MAIDERARHELYQRLEQALGEEATTTLMAYLPPVGWTDVATKADLQSLEQKLVAEFHRELNATTRTVVLSVVGTNVGIAGLALALAQALG